MSLSPKLVLKLEEEKIIVECVKLLQQKVSVNEYPKEQIDELKDVIRSLENVFSLTKNGLTDVDRNIQKTYSLTQEGNKLFKNSNYNAAVEKYSEAIKLNRNPICFFNRGSANSCLGKLDEAIRDYQEAVFLDHKYSRAYWKLGIMLEKKNRLVEATDAFQKAVDLSPENEEFKPALFNALQKREGLYSEPSSDSDNDGIQVSKSVGTSGNPKVDIASEAVQKSSKTTRTNEFPKTPIIDPGNVGFRDPSFGKSEKSSASTEPQDPTPSQTEELNFSFKSFTLLEESNNPVKNASAGNSEDRSKEKSASEAVVVPKINQNSPKQSSLQKMDTEDLLDIIHENTISSTKRKPSPDDQAFDSVSVPISAGDLKNRTSDEPQETVSKKNKIEKTDVLKVKEEEAQFFFETIEITPNDGISDPEKEREFNLTVISPSDPSIKPLQFQYLKYIIDDCEIVNYDQVAPMKHAIADNIEPVPPMNLLNFWKYRKFYHFSELVLLYQYIYEFTLTEDFGLDVYQRILDMVVKHEKIFSSCVHFARAVELMLEFKFLYIPDESDKRQIAVNRELENLTMIPLASGMPSMLMYSLIEKHHGRINVQEFKRDFDCPREIFVEHLLKTLNRRPDLFLLKSNNYDRNFWTMDIVLNPKVCKDFIVYNYGLRDLRKAEDLHLRKDHIDSISQFRS